MRGPAAPLWTAEPSRFAGWSRPAARAGLATLGLALVVAANLPAGASGASDGFSPYADAIEAVRHGGGFYPAAASAIRSAGETAGALAPPTLAQVAGALPDWAVSALLWALAGASLLAWESVLRAALARPAARSGATLLLAAGLIPYLLLEALYVPEAWAGLFVSLSLARAARGAEVEAVAWGASAGLVAEAAGLYLVVMLVLTTATGRRRAAPAWAAALGAVAAAALLHHRALWDVLGPSADGGAAWRGLTPLVDVTPFAILGGTAEPVLGLALIGWIAWRGAAGLGLAATLLALGLLAAARPEAAGDWGRIAAAPLLAGLAFVPDGVRDLLRGAGAKRRRITVKRVVR